MMASCPSHKGAKKGLNLDKRNLRGDRAFSAAGPKLRNDLPLHIRQAPSLSIFKTRLETNFYSLVFNPAWDSVSVFAWLFLLF